MIDLNKHLKRRNLLLDQGAAGAELGRRRAVAGDSQNMITWKEYERNIYLYGKSRLTGAVNWSELTA